MKKTAIYPAVLVAALLLAPLAGSASAAGAGGWAWSGQATGSFTASPAFSFNSSGGTVTITNTSLGRYTVRFNGVTLLGGGNVQVVAYGGGSEYCNVSGWSGDTVFVVCFRQGGLLVNTLFVVTLTDFRGGGNVGAAAYLWWDDPPNPPVLQPAPDFWSFSSIGGSNRVTKRATGVYAVELGASQTGTLLVTAYDAGRSAGKYCTARRGHTSIAQVNCFDALGNRADSPFSLALAQHRAFLGSQSARLNETFVGCCGVGPIFSGGSTIPQEINVGQVSPGNYMASFSKLIPSNKSVAFVSSGGKVPPDFARDEPFLPMRCKLTNWAPQGSGTVMGFRCFDAGGQPATALGMDVSYVTTQ